MAVKRASALLSLFLPLLFVATAGKRLRRNRCSTAGPRCSAAARSCRRLRGVYTRDILLRFEGKPAADFSFDALDKLFEQQPGKSCRIEIKQDDKVIPLVLTTKRMV